MTNDTQVSLPERVTLQLTAQDAVTILGALHDAGPYKTVFPIVRALEQQLVAQAKRPAPLAEVLPAPEEIAHHSV